MRIALVASVAVLGAIASCSSCKRAQRTSAAPDLVLPVHPTPVPPSAQFSPARDVSTLAFPRGCTLVPPVLRARVEGEKVRFALSAGAPRDVAVAWMSRPDGGAPLFVHGILRVDGQSAGRDLTWFETGGTPIFAAAEGRWSALVDAPGDSSLRQVILAREGAADERLAAGDQLRAVDLSCAGKVCAALTTRAGAVAGPGATLFVGAADAPANAWARTDIAADQQGAHPIAIAGVDPATGEVSVVISAAQKAALFRVRAGSIRQDGSLDSHHGVMDATLVGGHLAAASLGNTVDERGCSPEGVGKVVVQVTGSAESVMDTPAAPRSAMMRPLSKGALLAWLSPVNCLHPDRWIVYAVLLDEAGRPVGGPMAVSDASGFSLATHDDEATLMLDTPEGITRIAMRCGR
ncbi:MAG: hypothetical protein HY898_11515 [Deltaproteobacteria bacterium]|nr:hypothetical protein [Deltaproteobacteria bacterium]